jgi:hypothetical protein
MDIKILFSRSKERAQIQGVWEYDAVEIFEPKRQKKEVGENIITLVMCSNQRWLRVELKGRSRTVVPPLADLRTHYIIIMPRIRASRFRIFRI